MLAVSGQRRHGAWRSAMPTLCAFGLLATVSSICFSSSQPRLGVLSSSASLAITGGQCSLVDLYAQYVCEDQLPATCHSSGGGLWCEGHCGGVCYRQPRFYNNGPGVDRAFPTLVDCDWFPYDKRCVWVWFSFCQCVDGIPPYETPCGNYNTWQGCPG